MFYSIKQSAFGNHLLLEGGLTPTIGQVSMQCGYPLTIDKKGGKSYTVACGRCLACRINRTTEWTTRILHEARMKDDNIFITLTYRTEDLPVKGSLSKQDLQLFFKRFRKNLGRKIRYFACGEYGERRERPHYHAIIFGASEKDRAVIEKSWSKGFIHIGTVTEQSARYCAKYVQKQLHGEDREYYKERGIEREFSVMSRRPGIGAVFAKVYKDTWREHGYISQGGEKKPIPRYYKAYWTALERERYNQTMVNRRYELLHSEHNGNLKEVFKRLHGEHEKRIQAIKDKETQIEMYKNKL